MNIWQKHIAYLQDNPEGYWFKRKLYGWGWTPATKAGWVTTGIFALVVIGAVVLYEQYPGLLSQQTLTVVIGVALVVFLLITIKTGESPRWQWGFPKEEEKQP